MKQATLTRRLPRVARPPRRTRGRDRFERQADAASALAMRPGERRAARALTRAPAARTPATRSSGAPLARPTRVLLEERFGAELSAVRVHVDADAITGLEAARAFAAGRDVYFARGEYDPYTPSGLAMLAHEVAHVLQQTGRPGPGGVLHATERCGDGDVQCIPGKRLPDNKVTRKPLSSDDATTDFVYIVEQYEKKYPGDPDLKIAIDWIYLALEASDKLTFPSGSTSTAIDNLSALILNEHHDGGSAPARSFLVDILSSTMGATNGWWLAAAKILGGDVENEIATRMLQNERAAEFRSWLRANKKDEYFATALAHPRIRDWYTDLLRAYVELIANPDLHRKDKQLVAIRNQLEATDPVDGVKRTLLDQKAKVEADARDFYFMLNDRVFHALGLLDTLDIERVKLQSTWLGVTDKRVADDHERMKMEGEELDLLTYIRILTRVVHGHYKGRNETTEPRKSIVAHMKSASETLLKFWDQAIKTRDQANNIGRTREMDRMSEDELLTEAATSLAAAGLDAEELKPFTTLFTNHAKVLFANPTEAPPPSIAYGEAVRAFGAELRAFHLQHRHKLTENLVADRTYKVSATYAWMLAWSSLLHTSIMETNRFDTAADLRDVYFDKDKGGAPVYFEDQRRWHRHFLGRKLLETAMFANMTELQALATAMVDGDGKSHAFLTGTWTKGAETESFGQAIHQDLGKLMFEPIGWTPTGGTRVETKFTLDQAVQFFQLHRLHALNDGFQAILDSVGTTITKDTKLPVNDVILKAKTLPKPTRWNLVPSRHDFVHRDKDRADKKMLVLRNAKTTRQFPPGAYALVLSPLEEAELFLWVIPDLAPLVKWIRVQKWLVPGEDNKVKETTIDEMIFGEEGGPEDTDAWIVAFANLPVGTSVTIQGSLDDGSRGFRVERQGLLHRVIRLTSISRRIKEDYCGGLLDADEAQNPFKVFSSIRRFWLAGVTPPTYADAQTAALVLSLGKKLVESLPLDKDAEDTVQLLPFLKLAIAHAQQQAAGRPADVSKLADVDPSYFKVREERSYNPKLVMLEDVVDYDGGESLGKLTDGLSFVHDLHDRIVKKLDDVKRDAAMYSFGSALKVRRYPEAFAEGDEFSWDGRDYRLRKVFREFAYHPSVDAGSVKSEGVAKKSLADDAEAFPANEAVPLFVIDIDDGAAPLEIARVQKTRLDGPDAVGYRKQRKDYRDEQDAELTTQAEKDAAVERRKEELEAENETGRYVVTSRDTKLLDVIAFAVELSAMNAGLQRTAEITGGMMELVITTAEIVIPGGQAIMWTELAASVALAASDERVQALVQTILNDPEVIFQNVKGALSSLGSPETIWRMLLSPGSSMFDQLFGALNSAYDSKKSKPRAPAKGRLGRIVQFIINLGKRLFRALGRLKKAIGGPIAAARSAIVTRPRVHWVLNRAADIVGGFGLKFPNLDLTSSMFADIVGDVQSYIVGMAKGLNELELPSEIIPLNQIMRFVVSFIISKIPKVKIIRPFLEAAGWIDRLGDEINKAIGWSGSGFDPNKAWRDLLHGHIAEPLKTVKYELVKSILVIVNLVGQGIDPSFSVAVPDDSGLETSFVGEDGEADAPTLVTPEELQELPSGKPSMPGPISMPRDAGRPLGGRDLANAQSHFDQDFRHVRVHDGTSATSFTRSLGAEAATSGSHVFLGDGAARSPAHSDRVLRHELSHVVQQTGSRPIGGTHPTSPVRGESGRGVNFDPALEAAADRYAEAPGVTAAGRVRGGVQPMPVMGDDILFEVLSNLTEFRPDGKQFEALPLLASADAAEAALAIWRKVTSFELTKVNFPSFMTTNDSQKAVHDRWTHPADDEAVVTSYIKGVAGKAERNAAGRTHPDGSPVKELHPKRFITLLEGMLYARTGIAAQINANHLTRDVEIESITFTHVNLAYVVFRGTAQETIWTRVMATPNLKKDGEDDAKIRAALRGFLGNAVPIHPMIWASGQDFHLTSTLVDRFRKEVVDRGEKPGTVPVAEKYFDPTLKTEQFGLAVDTHETLTVPKVKAPHRVDRESHHLPQFLLVEFFRNRNPTKAWPKPIGGYADSIGLDKTDNMAKFVAPGGTNFQLEKLDGGSDDSARGHGMPAILLSARAHQKGSVHVDDFSDETIKGKQSARVLDAWVSALPPVLKPMNPTTWNTELARKETQEGVLTAMRATYTWMYTRMMRGLRAALETHEVPYFNELAGLYGVAQVDNAEKQIEPPMKAIEAAQSGELMKPWSGK